MTEEHKCEIYERQSKAIEFAEKKDIYKFTSEQFKKELDKLTEQHEALIIEIIDGIKHLIFKDCIYQEVPEDKQEIIEIVDFIDNKERTMIHVKDFDKYLNENKCSLIYKFNNQRLVIYADTIYVEAKEEVNNNMQYI